MRTLGILLLLSFSVYADKFVIDVADTLTGPLQTATMDFFTLVYKPVGITPEFVFLPSKRGLAMVDSGELDAEAFRLALTGDQYPGLIRVDEAIGVAQSGFFCLQKKHCSVNSRSTIAVLEGFESAAQLCQQASLTCNYDSSPMTIAKLLDKGLIHAVLATPQGGQEIICSAEHPRYFFKIEDRFERQIYHYLNKKHHQLVPALSESIYHLRQQDKFKLEKTLQQLTDYACGKTVIIV